MNKNTKILIVIILLLIAIATTAIFFNRDNIEASKKLNDNAIFVLIEDGEERATFHMAEIQAIEEVDFTATLRSSGSDPMDHVYTGVLLKNIFTHANISLEGKETVIVTAADGYTVAITMDKFLDDDNVYLAYMMDGKLLGTKEDGGSGPYQMIIRKDPFSQFWCKFAITAEIN
ncbi:MAG: Uncharacterized protein XD91_0061 [Clostridiales bacterium 38_11]|nr:MAG: Uncharacterized protein XD91_0061 [Clostridiales bacterium 38_11]HBH13697.1 hypothetical protein [Clostridiales bacterium]